MIVAILILIIIVLIIVVGVETYVLFTQNTPNSVMGSNSGSSFIKTKNPFVSLKTPTYEETAHRLWGGIPWNRRTYSASAISDQIEIAA